MFVVGDAVCGTDALCHVVLAFIRCSDPGVETRSHLLSDIFAQKIDMFWLVIAIPVKWKYHKEFLNKITSYSSQNIFGNMSLNDQSIKYFKLILSEFFAIFGVLHLRPRFLSSHFFHKILVIACKALWPAVNEHRHSVF